MSDAETSQTTYTYQAQTTDGRSIGGTVDAPDAETALDHLRSMKLQLIELEQSAPRPRRKPLRGHDFITFNEQLAQLTRSGLPVERGLRLIAQDLRRGRFAESVRQLADELERGRSLSEAFEMHRDLFPALYSRLIEAGIKSGNLSAMLFGLGRHLELTRRMRTTILRVATYPLFVLLVLAVIIVLLGRVTVPAYEQMFIDFNLEVPLVTRVHRFVADWLPIAAAVIAAGAVMAAAYWRTQARQRGAGGLVETWLMPLPLIGPVLKCSLLARWCDAMGLAVASGIDLPAALPLSAEAMGSPGLKKDAEVLADRLAHGHKLDVIEKPAMVPATVTATIDFASDHQNLVQAMQGLRMMYEQQSETRLAVLQGALLPVLVVFVAGAIGFVMATLFIPLASFVSMI